MRRISEEIEFLLQSKEEIEVTFLLGVLADLQIRHERYSEAHLAINRALDIANRNNEKFYLSELYRLKGILAEIDPVNFLPADGSDYLAMARNISETQHAKAWLDRLSH